MKWKFKSVYIYLINIPRYYEGVKLMCINGRFSTWDKLDQGSLFCKMPLKNNFSMTVKVLHSLVSGWERHTRLHPITTLINVRNLILLTLKSLENFFTHHTSYLESSKSNYMLWYITSYICIINLPHKFLPPFIFHLRKNSLQLPNCGQQQLLKTF